MGRIALVLINTATAHGSIQEANGDLVGFDQVPAQFHGPIAHLMAFVVPPSMDGRAPGSDLSGFVPHAAEGSNPIAAEVGFVRAPIRGDRIGLPIDEVGVSAGDIGGRMHSCLAALMETNQFEAVLDEPGLQGQIKAEGTIRLQPFLALHHEPVPNPRPRRILGKQSNHHRLGGFLDGARRNQRSHIVVVSGVELVVLRPLCGFGRSLYPPIMARGLNC